MIRRLLPFVLIAFILLPAQAHAVCPPIVSALCNAINAGSLERAISSRVKAYVDTLLVELKMKQDVKIAGSSAANDLNLAKRELYAHESQHHAGPSGASCALGSAMEGMNYGGRAASPQPVLASKGGTTTAGPAAAAGASPSFQSFRTRGSDGKWRPNGAALGDDKSYGGASGERFMRAGLHDQDLTDQARADNTLPGSEDKYRDAKTQFDFHMNNFADDTTAANKPFFNADITAETILGYETFPTFTNEPKNGANPKLTMKDAADAYCRNVATPTIPNPNRGPAAATTERQLYSVERTGWDARLSLAKTICNEAVWRRVGKFVDDTDPTAAADSAQASYTETGTWFSKTVADYRKLACNKDNYDKSGTADKVKVNREAAEKAAEACQKTVDTLAAGKGQISDFEMAKTIYSRLMFTPNAQKLIGAANDSDMTKLTLQLDQLTLALNYRIYELQEKLALIKAAQLATMVERNRTNPQVKTPGS